MTKREIKKHKDNLLEQFISAVNESRIYDYEEITKFKSLTLQGFNLILTDEKPNDPIVYINMVTDKTSKEFDNWKVYYKFLCKDIKKNNLKNYLLVKFHIEEKVFQSLIRLFDPEEIKYWKDYNEDKLDNGRKIKPIIIDSEDVIDGNFGDKPFTLIKTICLSANETYLNTRRSHIDETDYTSIISKEVEEEIVPNEPVYTKPLF